jgi:integrase/recombinase XerD
MRSLQTSEFTRLAERFLLSMRLRNCSEHTVLVWSGNLRRFLMWCVERGIESVSGITPEVLAAYRRHLFHHRQAVTHKPLRTSTQLSYLFPVRRFCAWLAREGLSGGDAAERFEMPKEERRLPTGVLNEDEVERLLNTVDITTPNGLRNRAMFEVFYSTGMRCGELAELAVYDIDAERRLVAIRQGKGRKDRVVPIVARALLWVNKYASDVRPKLVRDAREQRLFVSLRGRPLRRNNISAIVKAAMRQAGIVRPGSCHLLRHTTATLMMERGADVLALQHLLGHEKLSTTQIYTHVTVQRLREVHARTHPAQSRAASPPPRDADHEVQ